MPHFNNMTDVELMARTVWGEARGEGVEGMIAVANVIMNRMSDSNRWGNTISAVIRQPFQFSVWNKNDPNRLRAGYITERDPHFRTALDISRKVVNNELTDVTNGANHYHSRAVNPRWARSDRITARIGRHIFYRL